MSELHGIVRFKIHKGKLDEFKRLSAQCMEIARSRHAVSLQYGIYISDDQSESVVVVIPKLVASAPHLGPGSSGRHHAPRPAGG